MEIIKVNPKNPEPKLIEKAINILKKGGLVIYPTDTVYGLGCNPLNEDAVKRIYEVKERKDKPLPILVSSIEAAKTIAYVDAKAERVIKHFWPGPLTIILRAKPIIPTIVTLGTGKVGVRMPNHTIPLLLAKGIGGFIIGTSANISGHSAPRTAEEAINQLGNKNIDLIIDSGPTPGGTPSTVIDMTYQPPIVIRKGPIQIEEIMEVIRCRAP